MSKTIDMSKGLEGLSEEDLLYLSSRGKLTPDEEREFLPNHRPRVPQGVSLDDVPNTGTVGPTPKDLGQGLPNPPAPPARQNDVTPQADRITGDYEDFKREELVTEAKTRAAEGRELDLSGRPSKAEIVAALEADDEA